MWQVPRHICITGGLTVVAFSLQRLIWCESSLIPTKGEKSCWTWWKLPHSGKDMLQTAVWNSQTLTQAEPVSAEDRHTLESIMLAPRSQKESPDWHRRLQAWSPHRTYFEDTCGTGSRLHQFQGECSSHTSPTSARLMLTSTCYRGATHLWTLLMHYGEHYGGLCCLTIQGHLIQSSQGFLGKRECRLSQH